MNTTQTDRQETALPSCLPALRVLFSGERVLDEPSRPFGDGVLQFGREVPSGSGISLPDDGRATRLHASLYTTGVQLGRRATLRLVDHQSKNGTFVNGARIEHCSLKDGDLIRIGGSLLLLRFEEAAQDDAELPALFGRAPAMQTLRSRLMHLSRAQGAVLLLGESGTGKELAARALHQQSGRRGRFIPVNSAAIPEALAENEFFGHVKGSFTGATGKAGYFRDAHEGTLFFDEIGDLPLLLQAKLLRVLEDGMIAPVGSTHAERSDVRVIAATNRDLSARQRDGQFRGDLYARLAHLIVHLPPLRARREDILLLLCRCYAAGGRPAPLLTARLAEALLLYHWPLNVRELIGLVDGLIAHPPSGRTLDLACVEKQLGFQCSADFQAGLEFATAPPATPLSPIAEATPDESALLPPRQSGVPIPREVLIRLLKEHDGVIARVAAAVGRSRRQIGRWLEFYRIDPEKDAAD